MPTLIGKIFAIVAAFSSLSIARDLGGRVVDSDRNPLPGVKLTWTSAGATGQSDSAGRFRLSPIMGIVPERRIPALVPPGGKFAADGRLARAGSLWSPWFVFRDEASARTSPLAKPAARRDFQTAIPPMLIAEKTGYATAKIVLSENDTTLPDIVLAAGAFVAAVPGAAMAIPGTAAPIVRFDRGTSTDLPNVENDRGGTPDSIQYPYTGRIRFQLQTVPGTMAYIRPHAYFPDAPETSSDSLAPGSRPDAGDILHRGVSENYASKAGEISVDSQSTYGPTITLLLWTPPVGDGYGTAKWMQFEGPVPSALKIFVSTPVANSRATMTYSGTAPDLDTCGRLTGWIDWKGPGARPEMWIGMVGTDLFAKVGADGRYLTTDLPSGGLPLAVVAVSRDGNGKVTSRIFYNLTGISVSPGLTSVLDDLELAP